jgi:hypothetical protein
MLRFLITALLILVPLSAEPDALRTSFRVKYVAEGGVYLDGGRNAGLAEGMRLTIAPPAQSATQAAEPVLLEVTSVADTSAVCLIKQAPREVKAGDSAQLSAEDAEVVRMLRSSTATRKYAQQVSFTDGDPIDEEVRELMPHPKLPEVNRAHGRIGFEYNGIRDGAAGGGASSQEGVIIRADITRIGGSYWNLSGYWRGRLNSRFAPTSAATLTDLLNRTYHLTLFYNNPQSKWMAGFGRFYLPWAPSLDTLDGGYLARRITANTTVGTFAGSTPDPTSWNYNPNRQMAGSFVNYEKGSYDALRYTITAGAALTRVNWRAERQFAFLESSLFFKRYFSVYHSLQADQGRPGLQGQTAQKVQLSRSFFTLRFQPHPRLSLDFNHNYFRDVPTFDTRLIGTGLVDKLLFQGLSAGFRLELPSRVSVYSNLGRSGRNTDVRQSWNQMYGIAWGNILRTGVRADVRYSRFNSSFGSGSYESLMLSRELSENLRFDVQLGEQNFVSSMTQQSRSRWINTNLDYSFGRHYFAGFGFSAYRGRVQNYDQVFVNMGYRF